MADIGFAPIYDRVTEYAHKVVTGTIIAGELHRLACQRHLDDLKKQRTDDFPYYYDPNKALEVINYAETLTIAEGDEPRPVKLIDSQAFDLGCTFGWYKVSNNKRRFRRRYKCMARQNGKTFENDTFVVPEDVGFLKRTLPFGGCSIKTVVLPESLTTIPQDLFRESLVEEVVLGSQVTYIDDWAFQDAINLKRVLKKDANGVAQASLEGIETIDSLAFSGTISLESIALPDSLAVISSSLFKGSGIKSVTFGANVTAIPANAFQDSGLTSLVIPAHITSIGNYAFAGTPLTSVTVTSTATWGTYVFQGCTLLADVTIANGVTAISNYMFQDCAALTQITIPDSVTSIGSYAFAGSALTSLVVPGSVASIGAYAFDGAPLTSITLSEGLTTISNNAFQGLALTKVVLPNSLTSIGASAFANCAALTEINIPLGVTSIGANAFDGTKVKSVVLTDCIASIGDNAFAGWTEDQTIYVTMSEYEAACKWGVKWSANTNAKVVYNYNSMK